MRAITITLVSIFAIAMLLCFASQRVEAGEEKFKSTLSGTFVTTVFDLDADSCTGAPPVCTDLSFVDTFSGKTSGTEEAGPFTGQAVLELVPVSGSGCAIAPTKIKSCTLGSVTNACEVQSVGVESIVDVYTRTGDILTATVPGGGETLCVDFATGNHAGSANGSLTGGTGKFADVTGTFTESIQGKILSTDPQGHSFGWIQVKLRGTVIEP
jgi:hypothetical protein